MSESYPVQGVRRHVSLVKRGWHVRMADGRWRLVERVVPTGHGSVALVFADDLNDVTAYANTVTTRTPGEQIAATLVEERERAKAWRHEVVRRRVERKAWTAALAPLVAADEAAS